MFDPHVYGKLDLAGAHRIASATNSLLIAMQEYAEGVMEQSDDAAKLGCKGIEMSDAVLDLAQLLGSCGAFSKQKYLSELLIYSAAIADRCEVCALTHIDSAVRARVPETLIDSVQAIGLYIHAQADDDTYMLFDAYIRHWQRFEEWPHLSRNQILNLKFYNLIALLMSMVVRKQRLVRFHAHELLTRSNVRPEEILEIIGVAQVMGGLPARWEAIHILDVASELHENGLLPDAFVSVLNGMPGSMKKNTASSDHSNV